MNAARTAVVTGGTGALGQAVVRAFAASGDRVVVPWIEPEERAALEKAPIPSTQLTLVEADLGDDAGLARLSEAAVDADILVNVAGGFEGGRSCVNTPLEAWDRMYRTNLRSAVAATRLVLPGMLERGRGAVIYVGAQAALDPPGTLGAYAASKAGVLALTRSLQQEVGAAGLRVNAVLPSTIDTPANREAMPDADRSGWTAPEHIAAVIHWLASDAASAVGGALVPV